MTKRNRTKLSVVAVVLLLCMVLVGIYAYFTDADSVVNEFVIGDVDIQLQEPNFVNPADKIMPLQTVPKDPQVKNVGVNDAFVFVEVVVPCADVETMDQVGHIIPVQKTQLFSYETNEGWVLVETKEEAKQNTYVYAWVGKDAPSDADLAILAPGSTTGTVFDSVTFANVTRKFTQPEDEAPYTLSGTWRFNDVLNISSDLTETFVFGCNEVDYHTIMMIIAKSGDTQIGSALGFVNDNDEDAVQAYGSGSAFNDVGWANEVYQTITLPTDTEVSAEFYEWFTANAVKQSVTDVHPTDIIINAYAIQTTDVDGGKTDPEGVWNVIKNAFDKGANPETGALRYAQPYNGRYNGMDCSVVAWEDGTYTLYAEGMNYDSGTFKVNDDLSITIDGVTTGTLSTDGTKITYNDGESTSTFTLNTEAHDVYFGEVYIIGENEDGSMGVVLYEDGTMELYMVGYYDNGEVSVAELMVGSLSSMAEAEGLVIRLEEDGLYVEGELLASFSIDGTQVVTADAIFTLKKQENASWLNVSQTDDNSAFTPDFVADSRYTVSGTAKDDRVLSSVTVNGEAAVINSDGSWALDVDLEENAITRFEIVATDSNGDSVTELHYVCYGAIPLDFDNYGFHAVHLGMIGYTGNESEIVIPGTITGKNGNRYVVEYISGGLFEDCPNLTKITIPETVRYIGGKNDDYISSSSCLTEFIVAEDNPYLCAVDGVLYNKDMTRILRYPAGKEGTTFEIPDSVTEIGGFALPVFGGCENLTNVTIGSGVTSIGYQSFSDCVNLTSITFKGTMEQWSNLTEFSYDWNYGSAITKVICTDGEVPVE